MYPGDEGHEEVGQRVEREHEAQVEVGDAELVHHERRHRACARQTNGETRALFGAIDLWSKRERERERENGGAEKGAYLVRGSPSRARARARG